MDLTRAQSQRSDLARPAKVPVDSCNRAASRRVLQREVMICLPLGDLSLREGGGQNRDTPSNGGTAGREDIGLGLLRTNWSDLRGMSVFDHGERGDVPQHARLQRQCGRSLHPLANSGGALPRRRLDKSSSGSSPHVWQIACTGGRHAGH